MRRFAGILFFTILVICFSCEEKGLFADCSGCTTSEPGLTNLIIKLSEARNDIIINIYEGEIEDSILYGTVKTQSLDFNYQVGLNKKYSITATYLIEGNIYVAFDSAIPRVRFTEDQCDEPCYFVYDRVVNLRLKYTVKADR